MPNQPRKQHEHWVRFIIALQFLTRLPVHSLAPYDEVQAQKATNYYPLVGLIIGLFACAIVSIFSGLIPHDTAILISIILTIIITGALHEDGFADCCDGFGGGWKKDDILHIMKDSRLGAYGAIGLICILALKYQLLTGITPNQLCLALLLGHGFSRFFAISFMHNMSYAHSDNSKVQSHVANLKVSDLSKAAIPVGLLLFWLPLSLSLLLAVILFLLYFALKRIFMNKIGGYTGDCLGAAQQISEVVIYFCFAAYF